MMEHKLLKSQWPCLLILINVNCEICGHQEAGSTSHLEIFPTWGNLAVIKASMSIWCTSLPVHANFNMTK